MGGVLRKKVLLGRFSEMNYGSAILDGEFQETTLVLLMRDRIQTYPGIT